MIWRVVDSRAITPTEPADAQVWSVSVQDDTGTRHEVRVHLGRAGAESESEIVTQLKATAGWSVVENALTADPTRVPTEITVSAEGAQPVYRSPDVD